MTPELERSLDHRMLGFFPGLTGSLPLLGSDVEWNYDSVSGFHEAASLSELRFASTTNAMDQRLKTKDPKPKNPGPPGK